MAASDGKFNEAEVQMLAIRANQWNITQGQFEDAISDIREGRIELRIPDSKDDRIELLKNLVHMMAIDGILAEKEKRLCAEASTKMGFTSEQFETIVDDLLSEAD